MHKIDDPFQAVLDFLSPSVPVTDIPFCDALFLFGSSRRETIDAIVAHAALLYRGEKAGRVIVSGKGKLSAFPEECRGEADYMFRELVCLGVPYDAVIVEYDATNTLENVRLGIGHAQKCGFKPQSCVLVSLPPHLRRSVATFNKQYPDICVYPSAPPIPRNAYDTPQRVARILAEIDRLRAYAQKGDIAEVDIPANILEAHRLALETLQQS